MKYNITKKKKAFLKNLKTKKQTNKYRTTHIFMELVFFNISQNLIASVESI